MAYVITASALSSSGWIWLYVKKKRIGVNIVPPDEGGARRVGGCETLLGDVAMGEDLAGARGGDDAIGDAGV